MRSCTADSDGYAYVFDKPGDYVFKPHADMEVDRVLLVGGGGSGGAVMGGGGGGGGVVDFIPSEPLIVPAGALTFDADLVRNSAEGLETRVLCGERIALAN